MAGADIAAVAAAAASAQTAQPLAGRVAIVTGASRGIGRSIAVHLSALGASLVLGYASSAAEAEAALAAELPRAVAVRADVADEAGARSLFDAAESAFGAGAPHILVANAGVLDDTYPPVAATATASFDRVVGVQWRIQHFYQRQKLLIGIRVILFESMVRMCIQNLFATIASKRRRGVTLHDLMNTWSDVMIMWYFARRFHQMFVTFPIVSLIELRTKLSNKHMRG